MANWLSEMSQRGMGLKMCECLVHVQSVVKKEKARDSLQRRETWYEMLYSFMT